MRHALPGFVQNDDEEENMAGKYKGKSDLSVVHSWRVDLPEALKAVFEGICWRISKDLPLGLSPVR